MMKFRSSNRRWATMTLWEKFLVVIGQGWRAKISWGDRHYRRLAEQQLAKIRSGEPRTERQTEKMTVLGAMYGTPDDRRS